ncbi:MAG: chemotaxis-specific protein-glutamate methyltransferase CheB [Bacteroidota bacterium]|nr:chemotaxis-specific protein-glutamate methyltransferase CheB [Bacteroidota bacterium]
MKTSIKVLVADDSLFMRYLTADILKNAGGFEVLDFARDGKEAAEKCCSLKPDVVVMDMLMGEYDGIMGVEMIMKKCPTPIVILSALGTTDMDPIMQALKLGAIDYHHKPNRSSGDIKNNDELLIKKVMNAAQVSMKELLKVSPRLKENSNQHTFSENLNYDVIVIGSSTGGPTALETLITRLPGNLSVPVVVAQHMPENFVPSFANRLDQLTPLSVAMAKKDDELQAGKILIAPGSRNMIVRQNANGKVVCDFTSKRYKEYNFPSVTGLMESVAELFGARAIGVILTGMGKDGAEGMKAIKDKGGYTIAQSKETCVVYGMPREAVDIGAIKSVVPLDEIGPFIVSCLE